MPTTATNTMFFVRRARKGLGFTLIELMITVAIVGILAAIALPNYSDYVTRGKIPEATAALAVKRVKLEQYYQDNKTYAAAPDCSADTTTSKYFTFSCSVAGTASAYTLQAAGQGSMAGFTFTVDQANAKTTSIAAPAPSGWITASAQACWLTNKGGTC
jgi:type IV pilus assembly protein PilE